MPYVIKIGQKYDLEYLILKTHYKLKKLIFNIGYFFLFTGYHVL